MPAKKREPVRIDYQKHWFVILALVLEMIVAWVFYAAYSSPESTFRTAWLVLAPVIGTLLFLFLVPPMFTHHLAGEKGLRLRMGLLINATIPYSNIKSAKETSVHKGGLRVGIGVRYFPITKALFVTSAFTNLVKLELDGQPRVGRLLKRPVEDLVLSVSYVPGFLDVIAERAGMEKGV